MKTPRIIAIAVKSLEGDVVETFAIHLEAEKVKIEPDSISTYYDDLERRVLLSFNQFVQRYLDRTWVHWDMDDMQFGFASLKHRYSVLIDPDGKGYVDIPFDRRINLNRMLKSIYGDNYEAQPVLENLMRSNNGGNLRPHHLTQDTEAIQYGRNNFAGVLGSLQCKLDFMQASLRQAVSGDLMVSNRNVLQRIGRFFSHPVMVAIAWIVGVGSFVWGIVVSLNQ